jgi:hypothetical protein
MLLQRISIGDVRQCRRPEHAVKRCHYPEILVCQRGHDVNEGGRQYDPEYAGWCVISRVTPCNELCDPMREQKTEEYQRSYPFVATVISGDTKQLDKKASPRGDPKLKHWATSPIPWRDGMSRLKPGLTQKQKRPRGEWRMQPLPTRSTSTISARVRRHLLSGWVWTFGRRSIGWCGRRACRAGGRRR